MSTNSEDKQCTATILAVITLNSSRQVRLADQARAIDVGHLLVVIAGNRGLSSKTIDGPWLAINLFAQPNVVYADFGEVR